jgi:pimeloyl-ACP methyl ester carboxylesterase
MTPVRHVVYLHGFASSPLSSKAQRFARELSVRHVGFACPDLNEPSFETLTITRMLARAAEALEHAETPAALIGSSLGGFVALHAASQDRALSGRVDRLVLLAPAVDFGGNRLHRLGEQRIEDWRQAGSIEVFHHADNRPRRIGFELYEDAARYDAFGTDVPLPMLVFQGTRDASVDPESVVRWARGKPNVDLRLLDDDHQLTASMDLIWEESRKFLTPDPNLVANVPTKKR